MNCGKVGRPFTFSNACVAAAVSVPKRHVPYRQLEGVTEGWQGKCAYILGISEKDDKAQLTVDDNGSGNTAAAWFTDGKTRTEISLFAFDSKAYKPRRLDGRKVGSEARVQTQKEYRLLDEVDDVW